VPGIGVELGVLDIPGHTAGHIAFTGDVAGPAVFCGDTLFAAGCGRIFEGTPEQMWTSLSKLAALPGATRVYCGHEYTLANLRFAAAAEPGNPAIAERIAREQAKRDLALPTLPSTIGDEHATNPFLRVDSDAITRWVKALGGNADDRTTRFAALRRAKDTFTA